MAWRRGAPSHVSTLRFNWKCRERKKVCCYFISQYCDVPTVSLWVLSSIKHSEFASTSALVDSGLLYQISETFLANLRTGESLLRLHSKTLINDTVALSNTYITNLRLAA